MVVRNTVKIVIFYVHDFHRDFTAVTIIMAITFINEPHLASIAWRRSCRRKDDEILFVDYNTPDDFPTFPEAIQDTLSQRARQRLRIFRVRPHIHRRFSSKTRLVALEPISRNIALRRSNPANRWIL